MKYKLAQKAWKIDFSRVEEGYLYSDIITYAENRNKAKSKLLENCKWENIYLRGEDEEVTYLTIPILRCKEADKFEFEGNEFPLYEIERLIRKKERGQELQNILDDTSISHCYIRKGCYYRPNSCGYTDLTYKAGVYLKEDAVSQAKSCEDLRIIPINIEEHNQMLNEHIEDLKSRLL